MISVKRLPALSSVRRSSVADALLLLVAAVLDLAFWGGGTTLRWSGQVPGVVVVATTIALFVVVGHRSRYPLVAYAMSWLHAVGWGLVLPSYEPFTALMLTTYHLVRWRPARSTIWFVLALAVPLGVHAWNGATGTGTSPAGLAGIAVVWTVISVGVWAAAGSARRSAELGRLREEAMAARAQLAMQEQRLVLAREIHDSVAHGVSAIALQAAGAGAVVRRGGGPGVADALAAIEATSSEVVRELRRLLGFLRQQGELVEVWVEADGQGGGWVDRLDGLVSTTHACGVAVHVHHEGRPRPVPTAIGHVAFRVVQEALTNVVKHRGPGSSVDLLVSWRRVDLVIEVTSRGGDGARVAAAVGELSGHGLAGLGERVGPLGGQLQAGAISEDAYRVRARLPLSLPALPERGQPALPERAQPA